MDRALHSDEIREVVHFADGDPRAEQLRTQAFEARAAIVATADTEYRAYLKARTAASRPRPARQSAETATTTRRTGDGLLPALGVLVPGLAAAAAVVFLFFGLGLWAVGLLPHLADELIVAGLTAAGVAVTVALIGLLWLLVAAVRNRATAYDTAPEAADPTIAQAYEAWQQAVLERGVIPFLLGRLNDARPDDGSGPAHGRPMALPPARGADSAPSDSGSEGRRTGPGFSAPDFASPGFGSPDLPGPRRMPDAE